MNEIHALSHIGHCHKKTIWQHERTVSQRRGVSMSIHAAHLATCFTYLRFTTDKRDSRPHQASCADVGDIYLEVADSDNAGVKVAIGAAAISRGARAAKVRRQVEGDGRGDIAGRQSDANGDAIESGVDVRGAGCYLATENLGHVGFPSDPNVGVRIQVKHLQTQAQALEI